jgi:hypothetical protein
MQWQRCERESRECEYFSHGASHKDDVFTQAEGPEIQLTYWKRASSGRKDIGAEG